MKPVKGDEFRCPRCKECKDCKTGFQKILHLRNSGLVIYRHITHTVDLNKNTGLIECATKNTEDVFILHNTKNMDILPAEFIPEIEQNTIACPRCRRIIEHAQRLLGKVSFINKNGIMGVCEHCRTTGAPCNKCGQVVKKFSANRTENTKYRVEQWLSKIKYMLKGAVVNKEHRRRAESEVNIDDLYRESQKLGRAPEVEQMFYPERAATDFVGSSIEKRNDLFKHFPHLQEVEHPVVIIKLPDVLGKASTSRLKVGFNIQDHDNVYKSQVDSEDLRAMFHSPLIEVRNQNRVKKDFGEHIPTVPFPSETGFIPGRDDDTVSFDTILKPSQVDKKHFIPTRKGSYRSDELQRHETYYDEKNKYIGFKPTQRAQFKRKSSYSDLLKSTKGINKIANESLDQIRKFYSEEALLMSTASITEDILNKDFIYVFPKTLPPKLEQPQKSSSELIKDTQDRELAKAKADKKNLQEIQEKKLEKEERKRIEREAKELEGKKKADEITRLDALEKDGEWMDKRDSTYPSEKNKEKSILTGAVEVTATKKDSRMELKELNESKDTKIPKATKKLKTIKESEDIKESNEPKNLTEAKDHKKDKNTLKDKNTKKAGDNFEKEKIELQKGKERKGLQKGKEFTDVENKLKRQGKDDLARKKEENAMAKKENDIAAAKLKVLEAKARALDTDQNQISKTKRKSRSSVENKLGTKHEKSENEQRQKDGKAKAEKKGKESAEAIELSPQSIKLQSPDDDLILRLVKIKREDNHIKAKQLMNADITQKTTHRIYHKNKRISTCSKNMDSDIDPISIINSKDDEIKDIIIGEKILRYKSPLVEKQYEKNVPIIFQTTYEEPAKVSGEVETISSKSETRILQPVTGNKSVDKGKRGLSKGGVVRYALSNRQFIDNGWTKLPTEKVVRKMNVYRMRPAHPEFDWFKRNMNRKLMQYDTGEKLAEFDDNGRGRWFYRNGRMALDYYDAEELNAGQRIVIYSSGEVDERGRAQPYTLIATFDYLGNGIVFDHKGKIRLKYNQTEGVLLDRSIGPVSHWKWHTLNDPPVLQQVMIDTHMAHKDPRILKLEEDGDDIARPDNEDMLAIEFDNFAKEKSKKISQSFKPFQIKMKALKINEHFSLKVLDQATVYLIYRDGTTNLKLNIGMVLDPKEIIDTTTAEVGEVASEMERFPARTDSIEVLQSRVEHAKHFDKLRRKREERLRPRISVGSADRLVSAASKPAPSGTITRTSCYHKSDRKPTNLYYNNCLC